jgi:hypothetical protein
VQDRIASVYGQIAELEKQLEAHRKEISGLEADLKETTAVKERLQLAEKTASTPPPPSASLPGPATPPFGIAGQPATGKTTSTPPPKPPENGVEAASSKDS